ncbi:MAG: cysteine--tRNA ligase [Opitutaceae bacterium]|nr:cysteine--tRNA ligase [Opitutaceae bacterium]
MAIRLYDSLTRSVKELRRPDPNDPSDVFRFYNCGPTVYAPAHIGNFRTFLVNDVIRRLLVLEFGKDKVTHVRNLTDVDDKTIRRAREESRPLAAVTKQWTDKFHADCRALNCLDPHLEPTATGHIAEQVKMIEELMQKGHAYRTADGSVYFKVSSFGGYGALSRVKERELSLGSALAGKPQTVDADEKEDGSDFALWKAWKPEDGPNKWPGPADAAPGRPGWHIECSAMSKKHLGDTIDLHTGGVDLLFPHHENEIAQSECCNGAQFSRHWYHSEHLLVDGKKMSKSLGNLYTLDDLTAKGFSPMALRYALLSGHPRKQLNFTFDSLHAAESALTTIHSFWQSLRGGNGPAGHFDEVVAALKDDLNAPAALGAFFSIVKRGPHGVSKEACDKALFALGLKPDFVARPQKDAPSEIIALADKRWAAKQAKDFATADALRKELTAAGWAMLDGKDGYKLEPLKKA